MTELTIQQMLGCVTIRNRKLENEAKFVDVIRFIHLDKNGKLKTFDQSLNDIVNQGRNDILDVMFSDGTQIASSGWYVGLISQSGYSALSNADTMASHGGWAEFTGYSNTTRPAWGPGDPSGQSISNATPVNFDINATGTLKGVFVCTNNAKLGTSGRLWASALFTADNPVVSGDQIKVTYSVNL